MNNEYTRLLNFPSKISHETFYVIFFSVLTPVLALSPYSLRNCMICLLRIFVTRFLKRVSTWQANWANKARVLFVQTIICVVICLLDWHLIIWAMTNPKDILKNVLIQIILPSATSRGFASA